jgi:anti-sigma factor RsiW
MTHDPWLAQLDAYLDGELESGPMQELDRHLRECPPCAAESLRRLQWKRTVHTAGQRYAADPAFRERIRKGVSPRRSAGFSWRWASAAAMAAVLAAAVGLGLVSQEKRSAQQDRVRSELADLHVATLASASPVDVVSTDRHTVKPWFEGKIPFSFNLPELQGTGFELLGGRVSYLDQSPGAELIYRTRKHQISVFIFQERAAVVLPASESRDAQSFRLESWTQGGLRYFVIGDASPEDLASLRKLLAAAR